MLKKSYFTMFPSLLLKRLLIAQKLSFVRCGKL